MGSAAHGLNVARTCTLLTVHRQVTREPSHSNLADDRPNALGNATKLEIIDCLGNMTEGAQSLCGVINNSIHLGIHRRSCKASNMKDPRRRYGLFERPIVCRKDSHRQLNIRDGS